MEDIVKNDAVIVQILQELDINRGVISSDRTMYKAWLYDWGMSKELIDFAVQLSKGKYMAMQYLNRVLAEYHSNKISSVELAKNFKLSFGGTVAPQKNTTEVKAAKKREYSKKELDSLFDDIEEINI